MPREETHHPWTDEEKGKVLDPNPERRRYLTEVFYKFLSHKISMADLVGMPKKRFGKLAEIGYVKYKYGRYKDAMEIFQMLSTLDSVNAYYHTALGGVLQKLGRYVDSVVAYTKALRVNPRELCCFVNRGEIYLKHKNFKKAADDFRNAIMLDPDGRNLWANRARSLVIALKRSMDMKKRMAQAQQPTNPQAGKHPSGSTPQGSRPMGTGMPRPQGSSRAPQRKK